MKWKLALAPAIQVAGATALAPGRHGLPVRRSRTCAASLVVAVVAATAMAPASAAGGRGSPRVAALQVALRAEHLYRGDVDGRPGPQTSLAIRAFQRRRRLAIDGVAGPATRRALGRRGRPAYAARVITLGARGWDVAELQFLMAWSGFPSGPIDGGFGPRSRAALLRYQAWAGLRQDGAAGPGTLASLERSPPRSPLAIITPVRGVIGDGFGPRGDRFHSGVDFAAPAGTPVRAARGGRVAFAGWSRGGYGRLIVIAHGSGVTSWYAHLSQLDVSAGQPVAPGALIGRVGATGHATGPHLHLEVRLRDAATDPLTALG
jgi:murein DD-endopeptidase MepM/ murein hydrolase activator NlpD